MTSMNKIYGGAYALPHLGIAGLHDPIMTLEADVSVKRRERAARLGGRSHAGRDFTAPEKLSFLSSLTDHCFRVCGALELDNPHHVGAVAFLFILGVFSYMNVRRYVRRRHIWWNATFELDRTKPTGKAAPRILRKDLRYSKLMLLDLTKPSLGFSESKRRSTYSMFASPSPGRNSPSTKCSSQHVLLG